MDADDAILQALAEINARLSRLEGQAQGAKAVPVGNGRILTRANFHNVIFYVQADDRLLVPRFIMDGVLEPEVTNFFLASIMPESRCLDVGANFGYFACLMGRCASRGRTIAIEPDPQIFALLRDNIYINWIESVVTPVNAAAAAEIGTLTLHRRLTRSGNTSIIELSREDFATIGEQPSEMFHAPAVTLDSLLPQFGGRVDFMKVDVEGAEPLVFRGARDLIAQNDPIKIVMEWAPEQLGQAGFALESFAAELAAQDLHAAIFRDGGIVPIAWNELVHHPYCNLLLTKTA
jgi:FkbM family methyltransferase